MMRMTVMVMVMVNMMVLIFKLVYIETCANRVARAARY